MTRKHHPAWLRRRRQGAADERTIAAFATALTADGGVALREMLRPDVVLIVDSGGHIPHVSQPVEGQEAAAAQLRDLMTSDTRVRTASINGVPGLTLIRGGQVVGAVTAEERSGLLSGIWVVCNPDKLRHWNR